MKCKKGYKLKDGKCKKNKNVVATLFSSSSNYGWIFWLLGILIIVGVFWYGGTHDWFKGIYSQSYSVVEGDINNFLSGTASGTCTLDLTPNSIFEGDRVTGTLTDGANTLCYVLANDGSGWRIVYQGTTDSNGLLIDTRNIDIVGNFVFRAICDRNHNNQMDTLDCLTNQESLIVYERPVEPEPFPGYNVGDVVGGGSSSGTITGSGGIDKEFDMSGIVTGGNCSLGAKIHTEWTYANDKCSGIAGTQGLEWLFKDSVGVQWSATDTTPRIHDEDLCPLSYDGKTNWKLQAIPMSSALPECQLNYNYNVQIYVCRCS